MKTINQIASFFAASLFLASNATAVCPADPFDNTNWAFQAEGSDFYYKSVASIGRFKIVKTSTGYLLTGNMTFNAAGSITRLTSTTGKPQLEGQGGTLQFSDGRNGILWQFVFADDCREMYLVNEVYLNGDILAKVIKGTALRIDAQAVCPPNPYTLLEPSFSPGGWSFTSKSAVWTGVDGLASIGLLQASALPGDRRQQPGNLSGVVTTNVGAVDFSGRLPAIGNNLYRNAQVNGQYQVYPDCSGGTLSFLVGPYSVQYEFVFSDGPYSKAYLLSTLATANNNRTDIFKGTLSKY